MKNKFERILNLVREDRLRESTLGSRGILIASESDKGRVINSAAFRRLQQKAQVFPLEPNAAVRTRLTHSIEVSQIGRHICQKIISKLGDLNSDKYQELTAFVNTIETACLLHDIGNPPFGHFGESAIRVWFKERFANCKFTQIEDLLNFDGNPQGFRLASFLSGFDDNGFNLTCTLLLSMVKYPYTSKDKSHDAENKIRKIGLFDSEYKKYEMACEMLQWEPRRRFPLMLLMDAADDIAYSMSDLEDGIEKSIISIQDLRDNFKEHFKPRDSSQSKIDEFTQFKTKIINDAVDLVSNNFIENLDSIFEGSNQSLLPESSNVGGLIDEVKTYAQKTIYSHTSAEQVELAGRSVISGLLKHFGALLDLSEADFMVLVNEDYKKIKKNDLEYQIRLLRRIPEIYIKKYSANVQISEPVRRSHLIADYISGMTDDYALETYQVLEGIRIH